MLQMFKQGIAWAKKHKGMAAVVVLGGAAVVYLVIKKVGAGTSGSTSATVAPVQYNYPAGSSQVPAAIVPTSSGAGNAALQAQVNGLQNAVGLLGYQVQAQQLGQQAGQQVAADSAIAPMPASHGVLQPAVLAATPKGKVFGSKNYKKAVDAAGGYYHNHVFIRGGYQGSHFVASTTKKLPKVIKAAQKGARRRGAAYPVSG